MTSILSISTALGQKRWRPYHQSRSLVVFSGGMYSSNEYESLELEPKLLISVSALFYPKRSMVWSRCNGWGMEPSVVFCAQLLILLIGETGSEEVTFSGWCFLNNATKRWFFLNKNNPDKMPCMWTSFMTVLNFFTFWPELDNGNRYF